MLYFPAILLAALGLVTLILTWGAAQPYGVLVGIACLIIAFVLTVRAWWKRWTTEIFVTDRRVIFVHGFCYTDVLGAIEPDLLSFWPDK
jgi:hypothetical protein